MQAKAYAGVGDSKRALAALERTLELQPDHFYGKLAAARLAHRSGSEEEFQQLLTELKAVASGNFDVISLDAIYAEGQGDSDTAGQRWKTVFSRNPSSDSVIAYANYRQGQGDLTGATDLLEDWIEEHGNDAAARDKLAELYARSGRIGDAVAQYRKILKIAPGNAAALNNLAWYVLDDEPEDALEYVKKAIRLSSASSALLDTLAMAQLKNDEIRAARRSIDRARALDPDNPEMRFHDAQISAAEGDRSAAIESLQALLASDSGFPGRKDADSLLQRLQYR
jgi:Tfp pilus assembly protein PilF